MLCRQMIINNERRASRLPPKAENRRGSRLPPTWPRSWHHLHLVALVLLCALGLSSALTFLFFFFLLLEMTTPREDLVQSAVKFLGSDKVSAAPLDTQKKFLKGKSLTDEEIDEALARVKNVPPAIPPREEQIAMVENAQQLPEQQQWNRKDIVLASLAVVSAAYAGYTFVKVRPFPLLQKTHACCRQRLFRCWSSTASPETESSRHTRIKSSRSTNS